MALILLCQCVVAFELCPHIGYDIDLDIDQRLEERIDSWRGIPWYAYSLGECLYIYLNEFASKYYGDFSSVVVGRFDILA